MIYNESMLAQKIREDMTAAMKARDTLRVMTLRGAIAAFTNYLVEKGRKPTEEVSDEDALVVIRRSVKQRKDSIEQFRNGKREDLAQKEEAELEILESYLPAQMSREQVEEVAKKLKEKMAKTATGGSPDAANIAAFRGKFIGMVMKELKGQADGAVVKEVVEGLL